MEEGEIIEVESSKDYKPTVSKLREKIRLLGDIQKRILTDKCKQNFDAILKENAADMLTKQQRDNVVNLYSKPHIGVENIMAKLNIDDCQFISILSLSLWKDMEKKSKLDLTKIIKFGAIEENQVLRLIDLLLTEEKQLISMTDLTNRLYIVPSDALLLLTMIWTELEFPSVARLFEAHLSNPTREPEPVTEEMLSKAEDEFKQLLDEHIKLYSDKRDEDDSEMQAELDADLKATMEIIESLSEGTEELQNDTKNLRESVSRVPEHAYCIETIVDSSEDSESEDEDGLYVIVQKINSKWPKWLEQDLCQANLNERIFIDQKCFVFAPLAKIFAKDPIAAGTEGYVKCQVLATSVDGQCTVKGIHPELTGSSRQFHSKIARNQMAMGEAPSIRCQEGTRVLALCERATETVGDWPVKYFTGTIAVQPFSQNRYEYLVFFDKGFEAYVKPEDIRLMFDQPIDEYGKFQPRYAYKKVLSTNPQRAHFIQRYLLLYPDWQLIQLKKLENTQRILAVRNGVRDSAYVLDVDRQLALLRFSANNRVAWPTQTQRISAKDCVVINCKEHSHNDEWVYRGDPARFPTLQQAHEKERNLRIPEQNSRARRGRKQHSQLEMAHPPNKTVFYQAIQHMIEKNKNEKQTARKSSSKRLLLEPIHIARPADEVEGEEESEEMRRKRQVSMQVVEERIKLQKRTCPKNVHRPSVNGKIACSPDCLKGVSVVKREREDYHSPCLTPILHGWNRLTINLLSNKPGTRRKKKPSQKSRIQYIAPCGIRLNDMEQVAEYLEATQQMELTIDMFTFDTQVRPDVRIKLEKVSMEDFTEGQEALKISLVNSVNSELPPKMTYRPRRTQLKKMAGKDEIVGQDIEYNFCAGCTCTDYCASNANCECRKNTVVSQNRLNESLRVPKSAPTGYLHGKLTNNHISGIFECNALCKCRKNCFNRVVQQDLKIPLQLFMTADKGWGVRTLVDIPEGTFVSTYSGEILDEQVAEKQGKELGDRYLADLDLIARVHNEKENRGIWLIPDEGFEGDEEENEEEANNNEPVLVTLSDDEAFDEPGTSLQLGGSFDGEAAGEPPSEFDEQLRAMAVGREQPSQEKQAKKSVRHFSLEDYFGDNFLFVVDAANTGNIGRFLNHSCDPNCFIQSCLVDTWDLRLPWIAFFTGRFVRAGEELTWDYGYEVGSGSNLKIICKCGAESCKGVLI